MEENYKGSPMLKGRLVNLIRMIVDMVFNQEYQLPSMDEFLDAFTKVYTMKDNADVPMFLQVLPWDAHWHIGMKIYKLNLLKDYSDTSADGKLI